MFRPQWLKPFLTCFWPIFSRFQNTTQNRHLIQNDVEFQWSVFIFLNRGSHAFVLIKFPLSLFNTLSCPDLSRLCPTLYPCPPYQFTTIPSEFWSVTSRNNCDIPLSVRLLQRMTSYLWCSLVDLLMIFFFVSPLHTDPYEHFNSYTAG